MLGRLRLADIALAAAIVLLALASANELEAFADAHAQRVADSAAYRRAVLGWPGHFGSVGVPRHRRYDVACALHRQRRAQRRPRLLICAELVRTPAPRAVATYAALVHDRRHRRFACVAADRCPPYLGTRPRRVRG